MGDGVFGVFLGDAHLLAVGGAATDGGIDGNCIFPEMSVDDGLVLPREAVGLNLLRQPPVGLVVFGYNQKAAGVLINAVDDAGANHPVDAGKGALAVVQQGVYQGAGVVSRRGMNHHPLGLIHHQEPAVLVDNIQGNRLRAHLQLHRLREKKNHLFPGPEELLFPRRPAVYQDAPLLAEGLNRGAAQLGQLRKDLIQALPLPLGRNQHRKLPHQAFSSGGGSSPAGALPSARGCFPSTKRM